MTKKKKGGSEGDFDVGYGKPPKHRRFKEGRSGNPKGRPKGAKNKVSENKVLTIFAREAYREVPVTEGNRTITLPMINVTLRNLMQKAAKGDFRSANLAIDLLQMVEEKGASDKAMAARQANQSFEEYLDTLGLEELRDFMETMKKATTIRKLSQAAMWQAQRAERKRLADLNQSRSPGNQT